PDAARPAHDPADPLDAVAAEARAADEGDPEEVQGRQAEAERGADEVLPGEQDQPGCLVPADAGPASGLHRPLLHAEALQLELPSGAARGPFLPPFLHSIPSISAHTTTHWGGYVLLFVYVVSQMASTFFMAATTDKTQRVLFLILPIFFVFVIARFPAGLVLYWVTTNLWTVGQGLITRRLMPKTPPPSVLQKRTAPEAPEAAAEE